MTQNIISLNFTDADLTTIDEGLDLLEEKLAPLTGLSPDVRRGLVKMGDKSEAFCRETLMVLAQNTHLLPPSFDLADAQKISPSSRSSVRAQHACAACWRRLTMARPRSAATR
jgi:hypothetical protein